MAQSIVEIKDLSFGYKGKLLHHGINMTFQKGKVVAIMGGSGSGKTTLLRLIGGQLKPTKGEVTVGGEVVHHQDRDGIYRLRRKMGMLKVLSEQDLFSTYSGLACLRRIASLQRS